LTWPQTAPNEPPAQALPPQVLLLKSATVGSLHATPLGMPQPQAEHVAGGAFSPEKPVSARLVCAGHDGGAPAPW
jgi:hypothetical protein